MKGKKIMFLVVLCVICVSCEQEEFDISNPNVKEFVQIVKDDEYKSEIGYDLPAFKVEQIEELLLFTDDVSQISFFPTNPISSKRTEPNILGECLLWTIEGIRVREKYPSLEPHLVDTTSYTRLSNEELLAISTIYKNWWNEYKHNPSESLRSKALLKDTSYRWN